MVIKIAAGENVSKRLIKCATAIQPASLFNNEQRSRVLA